MTAAPEPIRLDRLPMAEDRTAAYSFLREAGPVLRTAFGSYLITSAEAAEFALRNPGLFSSRRAFDLVGSPLPLVPIAFDPPRAHPVPAHPAAVLQPARCRGLAAAGTRAGPRPDRRRGPPWPL